MDDKKKIEAPVREEFNRFMEDFKHSLQSETRHLQSAIDFILDAKGKHIRPLLVLLTAKACGRVTDDTINSAVLLELLHTATLIHDDVIDETKQRRGVPSLNAIYDNRVSVLVGDYILSTSLMRSTLTGDLRIVKIISELGRDLSEGEIQQLETAEETILDEACYLGVIRKKTATLLSACTEIGAISAGASDELLTLCREFGVQVGYCFQIRDDIFDYFEDSKIGKPTGNDIREGKITLPLLYALRTADQSVAQRFIDIIQAKDFTSENIHSLIHFAKENGGIAYAERCMQVYHAKALEILMHIPESEARNSLKLLADYIVNRQK
ncbi:polyprenyl synthetase family protein [Parabacteroides sp. PF5-9]|uniref:polyprenyl synthetase family protein n=1 Tax=Parabacteroides sp. PF5-9 TaxID=1742404 RepID=UPI0024765264|nr:polyprenyl synthetase family protein [Parabacteroides sp. PF5-9]MDH6356189.1 octaprenyl-diphosphate synthase [Parabacteroides sp. PF5-9]